MLCRLGRWPGGLRCVVAATDLTYEVEWSTDGINWSTANVTEVLEDDLGATRIFRASVPVGPELKKLIRLKVVTLNVSQP